mmetsp:Transcript_51552/g.92605  ORF Transcript_51552/g.92605 Transcript_51552/m.92605 type:complete len:215 (-) Transcript_51552:2118-2762(-)
MQQVLQTLLGLDELGQGVQKKQAFETKGLSTCNAVHYAGEDELSHLWGSRDQFHNMGIAEEEVMRESTDDHLLILPQASTLPPKAKEWGRFPHCRLQTPICCIPFQELGELPVAIAIHGILTCPIDVELDVQGTCSHYIPKAVLRAGRLVICSRRVAKLREGICRLQLELVTGLVKHSKHRTMIRPSQIEVVLTRRVQSTESLSEVLICCESCA